MPIVNVIIIVAVLAVLLYLFNTLITADPKLKQVVNVLAYLAIFVFILKELLPYLLHA